MAPASAQMARSAKDEGGEVRGNGSTLLFLARAGRCINRSNDCNVYSDRPADLSADPPVSVDVEEKGVDGAAIDLEMGGRWWKRPIF